MSSKDRPDCDSAEDTLFAQWSHPSMYALIQLFHMDCSSSPLFRTQSIIDNSKNIQKCHIVEHNIKECLWGSAHLAYGNTGSWMKLHLFMFLHEAVWQITLSHCSTASAIICFHCSLPPDFSLCCSYYLPLTRRASDQSSSSSSDTVSTQTWVLYTGFFLELSFSKSGGVHDSYTFQCGLVGSFTSPGIDTR